MRRHIRPALLLPLLIGLTACTTDGAEIEASSGASGGVGVSRIRLTEADLTLLNTLPGIAMAYYREWPDVSVEAFIENDSETRAILDGAQVSPAQYAAVYNTVYDAALLIDQGTRGLNVDSAAIAQGLDLDNIRLVTEYEAEIAQLMLCRPDPSGASDEGADRASFRARTCFGHPDEPWATR
jgi:hypothetical protein